MSCSRRRIDAAARLGAVRAQIPLSSTDHSEPLSERRSGLRCQADSGGHCSVDCLVSRGSAGWQDAGASGKCRVGWEAPLSALEQDLSSQTTKEVVDKDGASEECFRVVDESHLLQRESQHMGTLLQNGCNSLAVRPEAEGRLIVIINKLPLEVRNPRH